MPIQALERLTAFDEKCLSKNHLPCLRMSSVEKLKLLEQNLGKCRMAKFYVPGVISN
jgi:hypothetical protein